jgi:chromosome partitioning protein
MVDRRSRTNAAHAAEIRLSFGLHVFDAEIPTNVRLAEAPRSGRSIFDFDPKCRGAHAYRLVAVELALRAGLSAAGAGAAAGSAADPASAPALPGAAAHPT